MHLPLSFDAKQDAAQSCASPGACTWKVDKAGSGAGLACYRAYRIGTARGQAVILS